MASSGGWFLGGLAALVGIILVAKASAQETIQAQMASIAPYLVDVWVYRAGTWLVYSVPFPLTNTLDRLIPGETAFVQVTETVTLTYGGNSYPLAAGQNTIVWR